MDVKRLNNLSSRWLNLFDSNYSFAQAFPKIPNKSLFFKEKILEEKDFQLAEERMRKIEEVDRKWKLELQDQKKREKIEKIRKEAWQKLRDSDWTQIADEPLSQEEKKEWREYRVYLGNIEQLWKNKQILKLEVMSFEEWQENKPIFKVEKKRWYVD
jgi:hypothetical protein